MRPPHQTLGSFLDDQQIDFEQDIYISEVETMGMDSVTATRRSRIIFRNAPINEYWMSLMTMKAMGKLTQRMHMTI
jgi:hypothetical protein